MAREHERVFPRDPFWGHDPFWQILEDSRLLAAWSSRLPPEDRVGRAMRRRFCITPYPDLLPRKGPCRNLVELIHGWAEGSCDLREIDAQAEIAAFARACGTTLARIEERIGKPPLLRWGLVAWSES
jgi:hypothetical protein